MDHSVLIVALIAVLVVVLGVMWCKRKPKSGVVGGAQSDPCIAADGTKICESSLTDDSQYWTAAAFKCKGENLRPGTTMNNFVFINKQPPNNDGQHLRYAALLPDDNTDLVYKTQEAAIRDYCLPANVARHNAYFATHPDG